MVGYCFSKSNIGADGTQYMCFMIEPERIDEHGLCNGKAVDVTLDYKKNKTTISTFRWFHGAPHDFEVIKVLKDEIIAESELPQIIESLGIKIT